MIRRERVAVGESLASLEQGGGGFGTRREDSCTATGTGKNGNLPAATWSGCMPSWCKGNLRHLAFPCNFTYLWRKRYKWWWLSLQHKRYLTRFSNILMRNTCSDEHKKNIRYTCPVELRILIQAFFYTCQTKKGDVWAVVEVCLLLIQLLIVHCGIAPGLRMELDFS